MMNNSEGIVNDKIDKDIIESFTNEILKSKDKVCTVEELFDSAQEVLKERVYEFQKIMKVEIIKIFDRLKGESAEDLLQKFNNSNFTLNRDFLEKLSSIVSSQKLTGVNLDSTAKQAEMRADELFCKIILKRLYEESEIIESGLNKYHSRKHTSRSRYNDLVFSLYQLMKIGTVKIIIKNMTDLEFDELLHAMDKKIQYSYDALEQGSDPNNFIERKNYYKKHNRNFMQTIIARISKTDIAQKVKSFSREPLKFFKEYISSSFKFSNKKEASKRNEIQELFSNSIPQPLASLIPNIPNTPMNFIQLFLMNQITVFVVSVNSVALFVGLGYAIFPPVAMYILCISTIKQINDLTSYDTEKQGSMHNNTPTKNVQINCKDDQKELSSSVSAVNYESISKNSSQLQR